MKRSSSVTLGAAILMAATSVLATDAASVGRRASRQDILAGHVSTSSSSNAPVADRSEQSVLDEGLMPVQPIVPPEIDVLGTVVKTQAGLFLEGVQVDLEVRRTETHSSIQLDRISMDPNEMVESMASKTPAVRPFIDRPILAGN